MATTKAIEIHKALADDTRYRLYRFVGLAGRPVSVREVSRRLNLHPNTVRPHLRRLEDAGLVASEMRRGAVGRPQVLYSVREPDDEESGDDSSDGGNGASDAPTGGSDGGSDAAEREEAGAAA